MQCIAITLENVGIAVRDLEAIFSFFTELGLTVLGRDSVSGERADTAVGIDGNHARIALLQTPDGRGQRSPTIGMHRVAFSVDDIEEALAITAKHGRLSAPRRRDLRRHLHAQLCPRPKRHHLMFAEELKKN